MNDATLKHIRAWFAAYAQEYVRRSRRPAGMLRLKLEHSRRVAEEARSLAEDLGWSREDINTAEALGLLHDTGRFSQIEEFGTFRDRDSINHAVRGREVVSRAGVLHLCSPRRERQILEGILHHNALAIPANADPGSMAFIRLIRDADKLDICRVFADAIRENRLQEFPEIIHGVDLEGPVSDTILKTLQQRRVPSYSAIRSLNDWQLVQVSWVIDLHYPPAFRRLLERRILEQAAQRLPDIPAVKEIMEWAIAFARTKLGEE